MKRKHIIEVVAAALVIGAVIYFVAPSFADPGFIVANAASGNVRVTAYWRDNKKVIGLMKPSVEVRFSVEDEAAMWFSARYEGGRMAESMEIYFTSGVVVNATITDSGISVDYDFNKRGR